MTSLRIQIATALAMIMAASLVPARATPGTTYIFLDNDFSGPGGSDIQSLVPLLNRPSVTVLGLGVVTGDAWRDEETAHLLRFLEIAAASDVPVHPGAEMPLLRTPGEMSRWEGQFGPILWKGAWQATGHGGTDHPDAPHRIPPLTEGAPHLTASRTDAAQALIAAVHTYPHQVTLVAAGPLTDVALAIRQDPEVPHLVRQLILMGGLVDISLDQIRVEQMGGVDYNTDFNMIFDPEAAHMVFTAPWPRVTVLGKVTLRTAMTARVKAQLAQLHSPAGDYLAAYAQVGTPFWDEIATAIAVDPTLATEEVLAAMDVNSAPGLDYGRAHAWAPRLAPPGTDVVHLVQAIDERRFLEAFVQAAARQGKHSPTTPADASLRSAH